MIHKQHDQKDEQKMKVFQNYSHEQIINILQNETQNSKLNSVNNDQISKSQSEQFFSIYSDFFKSVKIYQNLATNIIFDQFLKSETKNKLFSILQQNGFIITDQSSKFNSRQSNQLNIKVVFQSTFYDVVEILCQMSSFTKRYIILNQNKQSFRHQNNVIGIGTFGKIYCCQQKLNPDNNESVIKCINYNETDPLELKSIIKEFFICDMMSALRIGPKVLRRCGFDFILFQNCIEFEMQRCAPCKYESLQKDAKQSLFTMHILQMIHLDIKPANIMYSKIFEKNVLLDFGISQLISEKWGLKTLTKFKGTFQFCGEQMRKIFMEKDLSQVNLYLNDVIMLKNSFLFFQSLSASSQSQNRVIDKINHTQKKQSQISEYLLELKYQLYINQFSEKTTEQFQIFFKKLNSIQQSKERVRIAIEGSFFAQKMQICCLKNFVNYFLSDNPELKDFQIQAISMISSRIFASQFSQNQLSEKEKNKIKKYSKIIKNLQTSAENDETKEITYKKRFTNLQLKNVEFILLHKAQLQKLPDEQKYELYLNYCLFWKPKFKVEYEKKLKASQIIAELIQNHPEYQNQNSSEFVESIRTKIDFVYRYLISYCLEGEFTQFKENYMMSILKDCIILGFQYFCFMKDFVTYYFKNLIKKGSKKLITLITIEFMELNFLTKNHFSVSNSQDPFAYRQKYFFICSKQIISDLLKDMREVMQKNQEYTKKVSVMEIIWGTLLDEEFTMHECYFLEQIYVSNIILIVRMIERQFSDNKIQEFHSLSLMAISYIQVIVKSINNHFELNLSFQTNLSKCYDGGIDKIWGLKLIKLINLRYLHDKWYKAQQIIQYFDKNIDCFELSSYFFVSFRFQIKKNSKNLKKITQSFSNQFLSNLLNQRNFFINYLMQIQLIPNYVFNTLALSQKNILYQDKVTSLIYQLLRFFFDNQQFQKLKSCMLPIKKSNNSFRQYYSERNQQVIKSILLQLFKEDIRGKNRYLICINLLDCYPVYELDYLKIRNEILRIYLQMVKKGQHILPAQKFFFQQLIIQNYFLQDQILVIWQNKKLQMILDSSEIQLEQYSIFKQVFVKTRNYKCLLQFMILSIKQRFFENNFQFNLALESFDNEKIEQDDGLFHQFQNFFTINRSKNNYNKNHILLLLRILKKSLGLRKNKYKWGTYLLNFYYIYQQLKASREATKQILSLINKKLYLFSYEFIKNQQRNKRKILCIMRGFYKSKLPCVIKQEQQIYISFENQSNKIIFPSKKLILNSLFHNKINKKLNNYINTGLNEQNVNLKNIVNLQVCKNVLMQQIQWYKYMQKNTQLMQKIKTRDYFLIRMKIVQWEQLHIVNQLKAKGNKQNYQCREFLSQLDDEVYNNHQQFIDFVANSQQYQLCEDAIDLAHQILKLEYQNLLKLIKLKKLPETLFQVRNKNK